MQTTLKAYVIKKEQLSTILGINCRLEVDSIQSGVKNEYVCATLRTMGGGYICIVTWNSYNDFVICDVLEECEQEFEKIKNSVEVEEV